MPLIVAIVAATILLVGGFSAIGNNTATSIENPSHTATSSVASPSSTIHITDTRDRTITQTPTIRPITTTTPTAAISKQIPTRKPTTLPRVIPTTVIVPTSPPIINSPAQTDYQCSCSKTCTQMSSCDEAYYQLINCGCSVRDGDNDGVPCESICPGG